MKKIAIITTGFTGSGLPLIKALIKKKISVDLYMTERFPVMGNREAFNIGPAPLNRNTITEVNKKYWSDTNLYMGSDDFRFFVFRIFRPFHSIPVLRSILGVFRDFYIRKAARQINEKNYDYVYFIVQYWNEEFLEMIKVIKSPIAIALHEVVNHFNPDYRNTPKLIDYCFKNKIDIVVFSENSRNDLLKYRNADSSRVHIIPFGVFETFPLCVNNVKMDLPEKYILFYGCIKPYKGLDLLYKAVSQIPIAQMKGVKIVVAGAGSDPYLEKIASDERFVLIHRFLLNDEIPYLISHSMAVVCPYHSMSQSGIPQTVYSFAKPLIASELPSFCDVIDDMQNGLLFEKDNSQELSEKILLTINEPDILDSLRDGVRNFPTTHQKYNWDFIADTLVKQVFRF